MNLATISAVLNLIFAEKIAANFRRDAVLPNLLKVDPLGATNSTATWKAKLAARNTANAVAEGHTVVDGDFSTDTRKQATLSWAHYESYWSISGTALRISAANGAGGGDGLMNEEIIDALDELTVNMSSDSYAGNVTNSPIEIEGLARAVKSTVAYAGIDPAVDTTWAAAQDTLAAASLSIANLRTKLLRPYKDANGTMPEFVICDGTRWDLVAALGDTKAVINVDTLVTANGTIKLAELGFRAIRIDGVPFIEDRHCTSAVFYALSSQNVSYMQTPPLASSMDPAVLARAVKDLTGMDVASNDIAAAQLMMRGRLTPQINLLAKSGDSTRGQAVIDLQLKVRSRAKTAKLTLT